MQLFVLGPAFGLPSIDAECIAAIALLKTLLGDDKNRWTLTAQYTNADGLPELNDNGITVNGFDNICHYLLSHHNLTLIPDDKTKKADSHAITSLLLKHAPHLVAANLYVSYQNYSSTTRPAFTKILPLYARFVTPPSIRASAIESTKQLGIASIDVDHASDQNTSDSKAFNASEPDFEVATQNRASLLLPKKDTVSSLLARRTEGRAAFKLRNLAENLFEPLQELLGQQDWLLGGDAPTDVDCFAYGYLSLMLFPPVPQKWLSNTMADSYPGLKRYVERLRDHFVVDVQEDSDLLNSTYDNTNLPWSSMEVTGAGDILADFARLIQEHSTNLRPSAVRMKNHTSGTHWTSYLPHMLVATAGAVIAGGFLLLCAAATQPRGEQSQIFGRQKPTDMTHLQDALLGLDLLQTEAFVDQIKQHHPVPTEVDIEIES